MVIVLYDAAFETVAAQIAADLHAAFKGHVEAQLVAASAATAWPADPAWDDLLVIVYGKAGLPPAGDHFVERFLDQRASRAMLLPVAVDPAFQRPPKPAERIKALSYDAASAGPTGRVVKRVGGMLGLRMQGRDTKIFISYRATDGAVVANQLHQYLASSGHAAFLDEAKELDGDPAILPGSDVQVQIDDALKSANLVLLVDTPDAPGSPWIRHEVETSDALLLPILPICLRAAADRKKGPRFQSLLALQRWLSLPLPGPGTTPPLRVDQLQQIVEAAEEYLCEIFQRRCRVPFLVEKEFVSRGFAWKVLDQRMLMYESSKAQGGRFSTKVCSHCSIFDQIYLPALERFNTFLQEKGRGNYSLFIYDGDLLSDLELKEFADPNGDVIVLHHQELATLIDSNFTRLSV